MARRSSPDRAAGAAPRAKRENAKQDRRPTPVFTLAAVDGQVFEVWKPGGKSAYLFQKEYTHPLTGGPAYYRDHVSIITIETPTDTRYAGPVARFNRCLNEPACIAENLRCMNFDWKDSFWVTHERADCQGMMAFLKKLEDGWRFPRPVMLQIPDPKAGEVLTAVRPDGAVLQAYADRRTGRIVVVARLVGKDGKLESACSVKVGCTPDAKCPEFIDGSHLTLFAYTLRFDPAEIRCTITDGIAAKPILDWLHDVAERYAEAEREGRLQRGRGK